MSGQRDTIFEIAKNIKIDLDEGQKLISENLDELAIDLEQKSKNFFFHSSTNQMILKVFIFMEELEEENR